MGQARRKGTYATRRSDAIKNAKALLVRELGAGLDEFDSETLSKGIAPFLNFIPDEEKATRRKNIIDYLNNVTTGEQLEKAKPIRFREDEIFWYLFLCLQALNDPLCMDISQSMRILPFFIGIGDRWKYHKNVKGLDNKIKEIVGPRKSEPDGLLFEVLVALSYAEKGWSVEFLEEAPPRKMPDLLVSQNGERYYVECKRQSRQADYAEYERNEFLRRWDLIGDVLVKNNQWLWFKCDIHCDVIDLPDDFFVTLLSSNLPVIEDERIIYDGDEATVFVKKINKSHVINHLRNYKVKNNSPVLTSLLGGDLVFPNSQVSMSYIGKYSSIKDCESFSLGAYIENIDWACGMTRNFKSEISIEKKSRDVKKLLSDAVKQVPVDTPSIIHIAVETLEGDDVEVRRTQKIMNSIPGFVTEKPIASVYVHRLQPNNTPECMWDFEETIEKYERVAGLAKKIPEAVVLPLNIKPKKGAHWEKNH